MSDPHVQVKIGADTRQFSAGIQSAMGSLRGLLSASALMGAAKAAIDLGSRITDLSARSQVSTKWLQEVGYAAQMAGSSMEDVAQAVMELGRAQVQALGGGATDRSAFEALGISMEELRGMGAEALFDRVADAIKNSAGSAEAMNAALQVMGRGGRQLIGGMTDGLDEMRQQASDLGMVLDDVTLASLDQLGDNLDRLKIAFMAGTAEILRNATSLNNWIHLAKLAAHAMTMLSPLTWVAAFRAGGINGVRQAFAHYMAGFGEIVDSYSQGNAEEEAAAAANNRRGRGAPGEIESRGRGRTSAPSVDALARIGGYIGGGGFGGQDRLLSVQNSALEQLRQMRRDLSTIARRRANGEFDL